MTDLDVIRTKAQAVDTTAVCDADKTCRVMSPAIQLRSRNAWMCGVAYPVRCRADFFAVARAIERVAPDTILVVDGGGLEVAYAGELFARAAELRGLAGIIVDGGYRDIGYIATCELPVYSRSVTPMAGGTAHLGEIGIPVTCGGIRVSPGDVVFADSEGIVVLDPEVAESTLDKALLVKETEATVVDALETGRGLADCLNIAEHEQRLSDGQASVLRFTT